MSERAPSLAERLDLKYWAFSALAAIAPLAPVWLARRLAVVVGILAWALAAPLRKRAERNLRHIPSLAADPAQLRRAVRRVFVTMALNYYDFFRGRFVTYEELSRGWSIPNWQVFEDAIRAGRGVIVMGAHLGPFEYSGWKLSELGYPLLTPAERLRPERFNRLVERLRNHHEARLLPGDDRETLRALMNALRNGQMAMFAIDRWVMGSSAEWPLFGSPAHLPTGPFALAARSDAPVLFITSWRVGLDRFEGAVEVITPERMPGGAEAGVAAASGKDREAAIARMRQRVYPLVERYVSAHPGQWMSALSTVWDEETATGNIAHAENVEPSWASTAP